MQESPYGDDKIDELEEACDNLKFQADSKDQQIATLKKALELACRKIADYLGYENLESAGVNSIAAGAKSLMEIFSQQAQEQVQSCHTCKKISGCPHMRFEPKEYDPCEEYQAQEQEGQK